MIPLRKVKLAEASAIMRYFEQIDCNQHYSNFGPLHEQLENRLAKKFDCLPEHICLVSSGWAGLTACLSVLKSQVYKKQSFKCLIPNHTFTATTSAALAAGLKPIFVDVDTDTWQMREQSVFKVLSEQSHTEIFAVPVSPFGSPINMKFWEMLKSQFSVFTVYDAAWSFDNLTISSLPAVISLHATKSFGIGEGGIVISSDVSFISKIKKSVNFGLSNFGITDGPGFNFKLSEYSCAVALANLDEWPNKRARILHARKIYDDFFIDRTGVQMTPGLPKNFAPGAYAIRLTNENAENFQEFMELHGIQTRRWWAPDQDQHNYYKAFVPTDGDFCREMSSSCVNIPFYENLPADDQVYIIECIDKFLNI